MKKLLFKIKDNTIIVKERIKLNNEHKNIINTNVISCNELVFSDEYLTTNEKIVSTFLAELSSTYNIDTISIDKNEYANLVLNSLKGNKNIINLILKEDEQLSFSLCEAIVKTNIKNINCYNLQPFMIEYLDKYNCIVESRNEILFLSNFMLENNLNIFSILFYKMTLQIELPMSAQDEEDFKAFCKINKYLKTINVSVVNKNDLEFIIDILRKNNKKNIRILIHENIHDEATIEYLRNFNKRKSKKYKIHFRLVYSNDYIEKNIVKHTNNSILKFCGFLILFIILFTFAFVFYDNYTSMQTVESMQDDIKNAIKLTDSTQIISQLNKDKTENDKKVINEKLASLYNINPDVVAWLNVPDTNIDYAVVQSTNNEYYLKHNFYLENDRKGWVFMDYRNDLENISDNVIIYAHNRYQAGIMFGTLYKTQRSSWYNNPDNQIITLNTFYEDLEYKVFSVYKVLTTTDYLRTIFINGDDRLEFLNMLKERSIHDFGIELKPDDKIITLSTCAGDTSRHVLHAVLQKKD